MICYCFGLFWLAPIFEVHRYRQWGGATVVELSHGEWWQHLESFHMFQGTTTTTLFLKVKLKHFILSIHDEPIVSCIFTKARFKSCDIKLAWLQPPLPLVQHWSPLIFLCNLDTTWPNENIRRIVKVLSRKNKWEDYEKKN